MALPRGLEPLTPEGHRVENPAARPLCIGQHIRESLIRPQQGSEQEYKPHSTPIARSWVLSAAELIDTAECHEDSSRNSWWFKTTLSVPIATSSTFKPGKSFLLEMEQTSMPLASRTTSMVSSE